MLLICHFLYRAAVDRHFFAFISLSFSLTLRLLTEKQKERERAVDSHSVGAKRFSLFLYSLSPFRCSSITAKDREALPAHFFAFRISLFLSRSVSLAISLLIEKQKTKERSRGLSCHFSVFFVSIPPFLCSSKTQRHPSGKDFDRRFQFEFSLIPKHVSQQLAPCSRIHESTEATTTDHGL